MGLQSVDSIISLIRNGLINHYNLHKSELVRIHDIVKELQFKDIMYGILRISVYLIILIEVK